MIATVNRAASNLPPVLIYLLGFAGMGVLFYQGLTGGLGADPVQVLEHEYGELALKLLVVTLAITPLRRFAGLNLLKFRRALGLTAFAFAAAHFCVWVVLDMALRWGEMWAEIVKRPYITVGFVSLVLMVPLAITSNNRSIRRMGALSWRKLHRLTYPAALLGAVHYIMVQKTWEAEPLIYLAVIAGLVMLRSDLVQGRQRSRQTYQ